MTVYTAAADGTDVRQISDYGEAPRFSPDGTSVMMAGPTPDGQRVTAGIVHADGSHLRTIPIRDPSLNLGVGAWAPDGKRMALEGWDDSNPDHNGVYLVGVPDGKGLVRLTRHPDHDIPIDFSPDGSQIVFLRAEPDTDPVTGSLYVVNVDGTGLHRITPPLIKASALHTPGLQPNKLCVIDEGGKGFAVVLDTPYYKGNPDWVDPEG